MIVTGATSSLRIVRVAVSSIKSAVSSVEPITVVLAQWQQSLISRFR